MAISGKTISVPAQQYSLYWVTEFRVQALSPNDSEPSLRAVLRPYYIDNNNKVVFAQGQDITLSISNLNTFSQTNPDVANAMSVVLATIESVAKAQGLI